MIKYKEKLCGEFLKNQRGDYVVIKLVTDNKDNVKIDIRDYYTSDDDQVLPTKRGVRFNSELGLDVIKALSRGLESDEIDQLIDYLKDSNK